MQLKILKHFLNKFFSLWDRIVDWIRIISQRISIFVLNIKNLLTHRSPRFLDIAHFLDKFFSSWIIFQRMANFAQYKKIHSYSLNHPRFIDVKFFSTRIKLDYFSMNWQISRTVENSAYRVAIQDSLDYLSIRGNFFGPW